MAILGIDEVGRGPWAGPLVIGAVILEDASAEWCVPLTDSKQLTPKRRGVLAATILEHAAATALGWVSSRELDQLGMTRSLILATRRAVAEIKRQKVPFHEIIIDGTVNFLQGSALGEYVSTIKKADLLIKEVSAASIIAKVARDTYMTELASQYPGYGFERHMGYGTALHRQALTELGPCPEHRFSFRPIQVLVSPATPDSVPAQILAREPSESAVLSSTAPEHHDVHTASTHSSTTTLGSRAEQVVADFLTSKGHTIISRNHKTRFYEIDIISAKDNHLYFTEVKYRADPSRGTPLEMITKTKLQQMTFAAEAFLKFQPRLRAALSPILAAAAVSGPDFHLDSWFPLT